jgi:hypothetical protein
LARIDGLARTPVAAIAMEARVHRSMVAGCDHDGLAFGEVMQKEAQAAADGASHRTSRHLFLERWVILTDIHGAK